MNYYADWWENIRNSSGILTKPTYQKQLEQRIKDLETTKKGQKIKELETKLANYKKEGQEIADFFKKECGFTGYPQARGLLNGKKVPELIQIIQDQENIISGLQAQVNQRDQEQQDFIDLFNQKIQKLENEKQSQKYQLTQNAKQQAIENTQWRLKVRPQESKGTQTDLKDKQIQTLINQWNQVAQWATEQGIDINQKWSLNTLKNKLEQDYQSQEQAITELQETIKKQEQEHEQAKTIWEKDLQTLNDKNLQLTEQLEQKKNWGTENIPQLKGEILHQGQNIYQILKDQINKATIAWGKKEIKQQITELDKFFSQQELKIQQEKARQKIKADLELAQKKLNQEIPWESWESKEGLKGWIKELEDKLTSIERERERETRIVITRRPKKNKPLTITETLKIVKKDKNHDNK